MAGGQGTRETLGTKEEAAFLASRSIRNSVNLKPAAILFKGAIDPLAVWPSIRLTATIAAVNRLLTTQQSK
jgi:hypothetical protein